MRTIFAAVLLLLATATTAAAKEPTGSMSITGDFIESGTLTVFVETTGINPKYEVTVGIKCWYPDGSQVEMYNPLRGTYGIFELSSIRGPWRTPQSFTLWTTGRGYICWARLVAVLWQKGAPVQVWGLDELWFSVTL